MKILSTILLLICSNVFMTFAWYGHLKMHSVKGFGDLPLFVVILLSWGVALLEYCFLIPANRLGFSGTGGPFSLMQLRIIQEVVSLTIFTGFTLLVFRTETFRWNHLAAAVCLIGAVYFIFRK